DKNGNVPAHIKFTSKQATDPNCGTIVTAAPIKAYIDSLVDGVANTGVGKGAIAIGSTISIYDSQN
ncbi:MAG: hypothetical protein SPF98_05790, partial [Campylobacter sp.]|nr:hypothetical protein [Campylobacter sp.]